MHVHRPTSLTVLGRLSMGFGAIFFVLSFLPAMGALQDHREDQAAVKEGTHEKEYKEGEVIQFEVPRVSESDDYGNYIEPLPPERGLSADNLFSLITPLFALLLFLSGLGLYKVRAWGRVLAMVWSIMALVAVAIYLVLMMLIMILGVVFFGSLCEIFGVGCDVGSTFTAFFWVTVAWGLLLVIYPILLLIGVNRREVRDALRRPPPQQNGTHPT